jgi:hypothetical protein
MLLVLLLLELTFFLSIIIFVRAHALKKWLDQVHATCRGGAVELP